jgi:hypothetical protein
MPHSTGDINEIPTLARNLSEEDLTFLDDVPDGQVDEFMEWVVKNPAITKWYFSNQYAVRHFEREQWESVAAYFTYLRHLENRSSD